MPEINLVDSSLKKYDNLEISIQVSLDGFSFCINSCENNKIMAFRHYAFSNAYLLEDILNNTETIIEKDDLLKLSFQDVRYCFFNRKSTIIPRDFAEAKDLKQILEFNQPVDELDEIHYNTITACNAKLVFALPTYFAGLMMNKFKQGSFFNQASPLLKSSLRYCGPEKLSAVFIQLNKEFFDIVIIEKGKLKLYNTFLYIDGTDLLYFILYACKQLKVDLKHTPFFTLGEYTRDNGIQRELKPYLPLLQEFPRKTNLILSDSLKKLDLSRFNAVLNLHQCE